MSWSAKRWLDLPDGATSSRTRVARSPAIRRLADLATPEGLLRSDVTAAATEPVELLIAAMAWGFGVWSYGPARAARMLATDVDTLAQDIVHTAKTEGAGAGFSALFKRNGSGRVFGLGVAMGSKLLYFSCRDTLADVPDPKPLIYDRWVYAGLSRLPRAETPRLPDSKCFLPDPRRWVSQEAYETWCQWCVDRAAEHGVTADDVEFALFAEGNPDLQLRR